MGSKFGMLQNKFLIRQDILSFLVPYLNVVAFVFHNLICNKAFSMAGWSFSHLLFQAKVGDGKVLTNN